MADHPANIQLDGMLGLVVGDALGVPVQFMSRREIAERPRGPVTGMEGHGTYDMPAGTWSDDSSMALAALESIRRLGRVDPDDIMQNFLRWEVDGEFTPYGFPFDEGVTCSRAIYAHRHDRDWRTCGRTGEHANGNGALMRILPVCLYYALRQAEVCTSDDEAVEGVHNVTLLTHNHLRAQIASGLYYFMVNEIVRARADVTASQLPPLEQLLQRGLDMGRAYYRRDWQNLPQMEHYGRIYDLAAFRRVPREEILGSGYVVEALEAALWCLLTTDTLPDALLAAVNLGNDTDTTAAIAGGLAGLYYGRAAIPEDWLAMIPRLDKIMALCGA